MSMYPFPPSPDMACNEASYAFWPKAFYDDEIARIINLGENYHSLDPAQVASNNGITDSKIRKSKVSWLPLNSDTNFIYDRIRDIIVPINGQHFQFDLYGFVEHFQYTVYEKKGSHYTWHMDKGMTGCSPRKLSVVVQLSDPSEYEGGSLEFMTGNEPEKAKKEKGMLYAFPSYIMHRVSPITSGVRRSLVIWLAGPKFK